MSLRELSKLVELKPEPQTTPSLAQYIARENAGACVSHYYLTPALREHLTRVFECVVHRQGQGFWVQAEYGAGKTHFLATLVDLLMWREEGVWEHLREEQLKRDYASPLSKTRMFPVAFSLRGMGESDGKDSLMRILEEQIRESLDTHHPELSAKVKLTSAELAAEWFASDDSARFRPSIAAFFQQEHHATPEEYRAQHGAKKFGQQIVESEIAEGKLKGKFKDRFTYIYDQITKLGGYDGLVFVIDEFRSWQDRHADGTAAYAEDEEILETLAFVLPTHHLNVLAIVASQGDMPQKLSGGGQGDRFVPLYLLADRNKSDFGEIVAFRSRDLRPGAATDIKDYYDHCRKEYRFIKQGNVSLEYFSAIFPFQPRTFEVMRRITQNADKHNLPTARSAIRMAWQTLAAPGILAEKRLVVLADLFASEELAKGLNHEHYREAYLGLQAAVEQLAELDVAPEERVQAKRLLQTLFLWTISLPENLRDGLTAQEVGEAAWLVDDDVGPAAQAEQLLEKLLQSGFPVRSAKRTREGKEVAIYSFETSAAQENPGRVFAPLKKKAKDDFKAQDLKWIESLFWQLADITPEAQEELNVNGGLLSDFAPEDQRSPAEKSAGQAARYEFPHRATSSTKRVHKTQYAGEVIVADCWRAEFGDTIKNADQHFRIVYLTSVPDIDEASIAAALDDSRIVVCHPESLSDATREALAELIAAEQMKRSSTSASQAALQAHAETKRREALKAILKCQTDEFRRGKVLTQKAYGIPAAEIFKAGHPRESDLAGRLLEKAYDTPLFSPKDFKKEFTDNDARKVFAGLFHRDAAKAEKDAVANFAVGLELAARSHSSDFNADASQAVKQLAARIDLRQDMPLGDLKTLFCAPPYGLTEAMVLLYAFALVKSGGYELALNPSQPLTLADDKPLAGNKLTTHAIALCDWNGKLERALLGARVIVSLRKGWNEVLPYARVLDDTLKPATPDEEPDREEQLLHVLEKLRAELPEVEKSVGALASKLSGEVPKTLTETFRRLAGIAASVSFQQFEAAARESYDTRDDFAAAFDQYVKARQLRDRAFELSSGHDYLHAACDVDKNIDFDRKAQQGYFGFGDLIKDPSKIAARLDGYEQWRGKYEHAYRKAHRAYYEQVRALEGQVEQLRPQVRALERLNFIKELGPELPATREIASELASIDRRMDVCPAADEAPVGAASATCSKCGWTPAVQSPTADFEKLKGLVAAGLANRFQRLKDATIAAILKKAAQQNGRADLTKLMEIIQVATADALAGVMTEDLAAFLRQLLYDENLVQEEVALAPIVQEIGAIEEDRVDEAVEKFGRLLGKAVKSAKTRHGKSKRVRVFLRLNEVPEAVPNA